MQERDAKAFAEKLDPSEGEVIFFQSDGQTLNPHYHSRGLGQLHVDAWACRKRFGTIQIAKIHSDDEFNDQYKLNWKDAYSIW